MHDTTADAEQVRLATVRAMSPAARLRQALELSETSRRLMVAGLRTRYPGFTDLQLVELSHGYRLVPDGSGATAR